LSKKFTLPPHDADMLAGLREDFNVTRLQIYADFIQENGDEEWASLIRSKLGQIWTSYHSEKLRENRLATRWMRVIGVKNHFVMRRSMGYYVFVCSKGLTRSSLQWFECETQYGMIRNVRTNSVMWTTTLYKLAWFMPLTSVYVAPSSDYDAYYCEGRLQSTQRNNEVNRLLRDRFGDPPVPTHSSQAYAATADYYRRMVINSTVPEVLFDRLAANKLENSNDYMKEYFTGFAASHAMTRAAISYALDKLS